MTTGRRPPFLLVSALILFGLASEPAVARQFPFWPGRPKAGFLTFSEPGGQFTLEYPKDWQVIAGAGDTIVTFAQKKNEAAIVVERFRLNIPLAPENVTALFAQIESDFLKERQPKATEVNARLVERNGPRMIVIDYARPGFARPERARQYSLPRGQMLFRLMCSAVTAQFTKYEPMFAHAAETFKVPEPARDLARRGPAGVQ